MMEEAISFLKKYVQQEYETFGIVHTEKDDEVAEAAIDKLYDEFYGPGMRARVQRPMSPSKNFFWKKKEIGEKLQKRLVFQVKQYEHPKRGDLFAGYLSEVFPGSTGYGAMVYFTKQDGSWQIIADHAWDRDEMKWEHTSGEELKSPGKLKEVKKIKPPTLKEDLQDYEAT